MDHREFLEAIERDADPLARRLCVVALQRALSRRQVELEHAQLPISSRTRIQNTQDLSLCLTMIIEIKEHLITTHPIANRGTERLLARLIGALHDTIVGSKPALFFEIDPQPFWKREGRKGTKTSSTMAQANEGVAAFVLDLLMSAMPKADAHAWLDREIRAAGLVDRLRQPITSRRVADWRNNFARHKGAAVGCRMLEMSREHHLALLRAPKSDAKTRRVAELAGAILYRLATNAAGDIAAPQERVTSIKKSTRAVAKKM